jgi:3-hydroxyacyl-CoA dehydrogenase
MTTRAHGYLSRVPAEAMSAAIIGGGKMGCDIAAVLAAAGWEVHWVEPDAGMRASLHARFL